MKTLFLILILAIGAYAQDVTPTPNRNAPVTTTQGYIDDSTKAFLLVVELRDALQQAQMLNGASAVTKAALQAQIDALNGLIVIFERKGAVYESLLVLRDKAFESYERILKIQADMIERQAKQLSKGKSAFDKFMSAIKQIVALAAGIALGKGAGL